jgi:hypothetical protein
MSMADLMIFPKTIQEFIEEYAVTDENGNKVIPVYRMEQAHIYYGEQIRNKAIDEFAERLKEKSSDILIWLMERQEAGYGTSNGELHDKWLSKIDEMAEQMKGV